MTRHRRYFILWTSLFFGLLLGNSTYGQFYKVYGYGTLEAGEMELVYWNSYTASSDHKMGFFDAQVDRQGLLAHSFEIEYGLSHRFTVAAYFDFLDPSGTGMKYIQTKALMSHYRFYEKGSRPLDLALYIEYIFPRKSYKDSEELETKIILEKDIGFWTVVLNPTFEKKLSGEEVEEGMEFNIASGITYKALPWIQPGLEYYAKYGELRDMKPGDEQPHTLFATIDLFFKMRYHLHTGVGFGLSEAADNLIWKTIFSVEFR